MIDINIRSIQHYLYCRHRWGLIEIEKSWGENVFVTKANIFHEKVHIPDLYSDNQNTKVYTSVPVYNDHEPYCLFGMLDRLEITKQSDNSIISADDNVKIVEYKPTKPKTGLYREDDLMQVFAQKICVDYVFGCKSTACIYYGDSQRRIDLPLNENFEKYDSELRKVLSEMRTFFKTGIIPPIKDNQYCGGCSMFDICMPNIKRNHSIKNEIIKSIRNDN